jgi:hypothetical protein
MDLLYHASRDGLPGVRARLAAAQRRWDLVAGSPLDVALSRATEAGGEEALRALTLDKGAIVLNMLRRRIGPAAFDQGLTRFYTDNAGKVAGVPELRRAFEASGPISLVAFFDQWLGRPGRPTITAEAVEVLPLTGGRYAIRGALVQAGKPWHLQVPLVVETTGQPRIYEVEARSELSGFELITNARPRTLLLDPLRDTLMAPAPDVDLNALVPTPTPTPARPKPTKPVKPASY